MKTTGLAVRALCLALTLWLAATALAMAEGATAERLSVEMVVDRAGIVSVKHALTFGDQVPQRVVQRLPNAKETQGGRFYEFTYSGISAMVGAKVVSVDVKQSGGFTEISVPTAGLDKGAPVVWSYTVKGAVVRDPQNNPLLSWRALQGLSVQVVEVEAKVSAPALMTSMDCTAGPPNAVTKCKTYAGATHEHPSPFVTDGPRGVGETVQIEVSYPKGTIGVSEQLNYHWSLDRAFSVNLSTAGATLTLLALGAAGLMLLHRRVGVDAALPQPRAIAEFAPVGVGQSEFRELDGIRPGHVGTIADERVDPVDITGTLLDLAVRGYLRIRQLPASAHDVTDWQFERLETDDSDLRPYERTLLDALTGPQPVRASMLAVAVGPVVFQVQDQLYDEVVARGWFDQRPDATRNKWSRIAWAAIALAIGITALLVAFTMWGLLGLGLLVLTSGLLWVADHMPRRTVEGAAVLSGMHALSGQLLTHPTNQFAHGSELEQLSRLLPYAVVLGGRDRWLQAIVAADEDEDADPEALHWYHAPEDWHLRDLPMALHTFINVVQGELFSR